MLKTIAKTITPMLPSNWLERLSWPNFENELLQRAFPRKFLQEYDEAIRPFITSENDHYLFHDTETPHKTLLAMGKSFFDIVTKPYRQKNLIEIGVGAGGLSYMANYAGMNVLSTDIGHGKFEAAGKKSRDFLGLTTIEFLISETSSISSICKFPNGRRADWIIMQGVPFNREYQDGKHVVTDRTKPFPHNCSWYTAEQWTKVLTDVFHTLEPGGNFVNQGIYMLSKQLQEDLGKKLKSEFDDRIKLNFDSFPHSILSCEITNLQMQKLK